MLIRLILPIVIGCILATLIIYQQGAGKETKFDELALGASTISLFSKYKSTMIHCKSLEADQQCLPGYRSVGGDKDIVLWLGNSQVHAINQYKEGQENGPPILYRQLQSDGLYLLTYSLPNANLQEHYLLFEYLKSELPVKMLVLPIVFDDLRETGIRNGIASALSNETTRKALLNTVTGKQIIENNAISTEQNPDLIALDNTIQEKSETFFNDWLNDHSELWYTRPEMRGQLFTNLHYLRNVVFNIKPTTKRKVIRGRYDKNFSALKVILKSARDDGVFVLVYIVPIRNDVDIPYDEKEYEHFKQEVAAMVNQYNSNFVNLENLIPARLWGQKDSTGLDGGEELDFMHFQAPGHTLLAEAIYKKLRNQLDNQSGNLQ